MSLFNYECDETKRIIEEVSPNYPQLTTYEKEWVFFHKYHYIPGIPVELECQGVIVNPTGTVQNAIPYQYKSAILKGSTKYRDIDTGDILDTFDKTKNLELVSVKMPVLTTTGKNLFDGKLEVGFIVDSTGQPHNNNGHRYTPSFIKIDANKTYCLHAESDSYIGVVNAYYYDANKNYLGVGKNIISGIQTNISTLFTPHYPDASYVRFRFFKGDNGELIVEPKNIALYESSTIIDMYEPYKSNILTVNEEVELRGIGEVKDEMNLLTGELTQRIDEVVLDGSERWTLNKPLGDGSYYQFVSTTVNAEKISQQLVICDKLISKTDEKLNNIIWLYNGKSIVLHSSCRSINELKTWLQQNPLTVQYKLATPVVKTVALTKLNKPYEGTNHYHLMANIPCEAILEVPVISTGEQTLQEINNY